MDIKSLFIAAGALFAASTSASDLDAEWKAFEIAENSQQPRTAVSVLEKIEAKATELKMWPDLAAAIMMKARIEYSFTEENALDAEKQNGLVAKYAEKVEASPPEVRPMLRLALAHDYISMRDSRRWWKGNRTKLEDAATEPPWAAENIVGTISNLLNTVGDDAEKLKIQKVKDWSRLLSKPDEYAGACRPTLWDFAVNDAVDFTGRVEDPDSVLRKKVLSWLDDLAEMHSDPEEVDARCHALYRKLQLEGGDKLAFAEEWFDKSRVSAEAACSAAESMAAYYEYEYEEEADSDAKAAEKAKKRIEAKKIAEKFANRWPKSPGAQNCLAFIGRLEQPQFSLSVENQLLSKGEKISVSYRNITNLCFKIVQIDFSLLLNSDFTDVLRGYSRNRFDIKKYRSRKAVAEWSAALEDRRDYIGREAKVDIPEITNGYYLVFAAVNNKFGDDGLPCHAAVVSKTDLYLINHGNNNGWTGFVYDSCSGEPQEGVLVEFWKRDGRKCKLDKTAKTAADGSWSIASVDRYDRYGLIRATRDGHGTMTSGEGWYGGNDYSKDTNEHIKLVTDRAIYRPGQAVKFKGYAFFADNKQQNFHVVANRKIKVAFKDPNDKIVEEREFTSNDFGTFHGEFTAPRDRLTGRFTLCSRGCGNLVYESVRVEEYKRPKFTAEFDKVEGLRFGVETKLTGIAKTYSGLPVAGAKVHWEVTRRKSYPYWCWWIENDNDEKPVAEGDATTDEHGEFVCAFTPAEDGAKEKPGENPTYRFVCSANVTDDAGEMHSASRSFTLGKVLWQASVSSPDDTWRNAPEGVRYSVFLRTLDGKDVPGVKGTLKVYALVQPKEPVRKELNSYSYRRSSRKFNNQLDPRRWPKGEVVKELEVVTDDKGRAEGKLDIPAGAYMFTYETKSPEGDVRSESFVRVIDTTKKTHAVKEPDFRCFEKTSVKVGETARLYFGTGYDNAYCRVLVRRGNEVLADEMRTGSSWVFEFKVGERHRGTLSFDTLFVKDNRLYHENHDVYVPWDRHDLRIHREHMNSKLLPDAKETWKFSVTGIDTNEVRRGVEALVFMFDKSLDAFAWHRPRLSFESFFNVDRVWINWQTPNQMENFNRWTGEWPSPPHGAYIIWAEWQSQALGLFETDTGGWRGGLLMKKAGRGIKMKSAVAAMAANCVEDTADVECCEMAPAAEEAPADGMALGIGRNRAESANHGNAERKSTADEKSPEVAVRKNLQETAFFIPSVQSDDNGKLEFSFIVPQALTGWSFSMLAHDKTLASGNFNDDSIVTVKPLMTEPNAPRFAREGDDFLFPVKVTNTSDKPENGSVSLEFEDAETGVAAAVCCGESRVQGSEFKVPDGKTNDAGKARAPSHAAVPEQNSALQSPTASPSHLLHSDKCTFELMPGESKTFEFRVKIPDGCGYLKYTAKAIGKEYTDGEEGFLPVLSRHIVVRESLPMQIKKAGEKKFKFEKLANSGKSDTLRQVGIATQVVSDPTWYAFLALPYLMEYPHECNEQTFSRFYANALAAKIANSDPEYRKMFETWEQADANALKSPLELNDDLKSIMLDATPWVRDAADETKAKRHIGELFGSARLESEQNRAIQKLVDNTADDGLWPWFPGGYGSTWVTMHILTGTARLKTLGIDVAEEHPDFARVAKRTRKALDDEMEKDIDKRLALKSPFHISSGDLRWLYLQSFDRSWNKKHSKLLFKHLIEEWTDFNIAGQSLGAVALWRHGDKEVAEKIVKSLKERAVRSEEYGLYWKRNQFFDCSLFAAPVSDQAVAMEAFLEIDPDDIEAYDDARLWMLEQKRTQNWSTTVSTVDAVYAILLGRGKGAPVKVGPVTMKLGEKEVPQENVEAGTGFYEYRYSAEEIKPEMGEITLSRKEDSLGWASVSWTYLEDVAKVDAYEEKCLRVTKTYYKKTRVDGKIRLVALNGGEKLLPGDELVSRIAIDSDRILEYVHLKDERPASAEPVDVLSRYHWQDGLGYYQSTKDTATHFYIDRLPKGNFVLETSYHVRQKGTFTSGLATAECMYAPEFGAHSDATVIKVEE